MRWRGQITVTRRVDQEVNALEYNLLLKDYSNTSISLSSDRPGLDSTLSRKSLSTRKWMTWERFDTVF
jgi:hypothetical protein